MRRGMKADVIYQDNQFIGVSLGSDYTAEHEWGIGSIRDAFGMDNDKKTFGVKRRTIKELPELFSESNEMNWGKVFGIINNNGKVYIMYASSGCFKEAMIKDTVPELDIYGDHKMGGAWSGEDFGMVTATYHKEFEELYEAFQKKDIVIGRFGGHVFENAGLTICIASKMPKKILDEWYEADKDMYNLHKISDKIGLREELQKAGKEVFALSPKWKKVMNSVQSEYDVVYWLNPQEQQIHKAGWYTVEQLRLWKEDKGPVMKNETCKS